MGKNKEDKIDKLFLLAVRKLSASDYSPIKMKDFLIKKGASKSEANEVLAKLRKYSILNEDELIENVISFCDTKHYGYNRIISMLVSKQVSPNKIKKVFKNEEREIKEAKLMCDVLMKKYKNKNTTNLKRNVFSGLIRYGFDEIVASLCVSDISISPSCELNMLKLDYEKLFSSYSRKVKGKELLNKIIKTLLSKGYRKEDIEKVISEEI